MKTSAFSLYKGPGRISIARYAPRGTPAGFRIYKKLVPRGDMLKMEYPRYRDVYFGEILAALNPQHVWNDLHDLAGDAEPVLLCWENLSKRGQWCHRRMVAQWFYEQLGKEVLELNIMEKQQPLL
jgi:hypothetical protein